MISNESKCKIYFQFAAAATNYGVSFETPTLTRPMSELTADDFDMDMLISIVRNRAGARLEITMDFDKNTWHVSENMNWYQIGKKRSIHHVKSFKDVITLLLIE